MITKLTVVVRLFFTLCINVGTIPPSHVMVRGEAEFGGISASYERVKVE